MLATTRPSLRLFPAALFAAMLLISACGDDPTPSATVASEGSATETDDAATETEGEQATAEAADDGQGASEDATAPGTVTSSDEEIESEDTGTGSMILDGALFANPQELAARTCTKDVNGSQTYFLFAEPDVTVQISLIPLDDVATGVDAALEIDGTLYQVASYDDTVYGDNLGPLAGLSTVRSATDEIVLDWSIDVDTLTDCAFTGGELNPTPGLGLDDADTAGSQDGPPGDVAVFDTLGVLAVAGDGLSITGGCNAADGAVVGVQVQLADQSGAVGDAELYYNFGSLETDMLVNHPNGVTYSGTALDDELTIDDAGVFSGSTLIFGPTGDGFGFDLEIDTNLLGTC